VRRATVGPPPLPPQGVPSPPVLGAPERDGRCGAPLLPPASLLHPMPAELRVPSPRRAGAGGGASRVTAAGAAAGAVAATAMGRSPPASRPLPLPPPPPPPPPPLSPSVEASVAAAADAASALDDGVTSSVSNDHLAELITGAAPGGEAGRPATP